jgi:hypothetical protein
MRKPRLIGVVAGLAALLAAMLALAGCGGDGESATAAALPTAKEMLLCMIAAGGHRGDQTPQEPTGFPAHVEAAMLQGPTYDHVGFYISRKPVFTPRVAREFEALQEFHAETLRDGRVLMVSLPKYLTPETKELALACLEG